MPKSVFIVGAGLIGWTILDLLVAEGGYDITALVRRQEHADGIKQSGATPVMGDLDDHDLIAEHAARSDIVFHAATADHLPSVQAILDGVGRRVAQGKGAVYIHTSGTGVLIDGPSAKFTGEKIFYDDKPEDINNTLPDDAPHRPIDLAILNAQKKFGEKAKIAIMMPPLIYGYNRAHDRLSIQIPTMARFALKHGFAGYVNNGEPRWSQVHFADLGRGYMAILHHMESASPGEFLSNPYFFCENGKEFSWLEAGQQIGKAIHSAGLIQSPASRSFPKELYGDLMGKGTESTIGLNSRSRAVRLRKLGWEASEKGIWESFAEDELPAIVAPK